MSEQTKIKRLLRQAHQTDPDLFERLIEAYKEGGAEAFAAPRPGANAGRPPVITPKNRQLLYADFLNRLERANGNRSEAMRGIAKGRDGSGTHWGNGKGHKGHWMDMETVKTHIQACEEQFKSDPEFREYVDLYRWAFEKLKIGE